MTSSAIFLTVAAAALAAVSGYYIAFAFFKSKRIIEAISKEPVLSRSAAIATVAGAFLSGAIVSTVSAWIAPDAHAVAIGTALVVGILAGLTGMYCGINARTNTCFNLIQPRGNHIMNSKSQDEIERAAVQASPYFARMGAYKPGAKLIKARELPDYSGWARFENFGHNDRGYYYFTAHPVGDLICIKCGGETWNTQPDKDELVAPTE